MSLCLLVFRRDANVTETHHDRLTTILISRFLFHLQAAERASADLETHTSRSTMSSVAFDRVVGSLGAEIEPEDFFGPRGSEGEEQDNERKQEEDRGGECLPHIGTKGQSESLAELGEQDPGADCTGIQIGLSTRASSHTLGGLETVQELA